MSSSESPTGPSEPTAESSGEDDDERTPLIVAHTCPTCGGLAVKEGDAYTTFPNRVGIVLDFLGDIEEQIRAVELRLKRPLLTQDRDREWQVQKSLILSNWIQKEGRVVPW